jgi:hypothetical protein
VLIRHARFEPDLPFLDGVQLLFHVSHHDSPNEKPRSGFSPGGAQLFSQRYLILSQGPRQAGAMYSSAIESSNERIIPTMKARPVLPCW